MRPASGVVLWLALLLPCGVSAGAPKIAIIIDDIGYRTADDRRVLSLPTEVAVAVLPYSPNATAMATASHRQQRPVLVHMPMQSNSDVTNAKALGPGALSSADSRAAVIEAVDAAFDAVPFATGLNNHMGSKVTQSREAMRWVMQTLACRRDSYFVDSYTTAASIGLDTAVQMSIPATRRHVFLDTERDSASIEKAFERLVREARRNGSAVAIGHPLPETLAVLERKLPDLQAYGVELVSPQALTRLGGAADPPSGSW